MKKFENVYKTCPVCDSANIYQYHKDFRENTIYKCKNCTVQFMNPVYTDEYLSDFYAKYYTGGPTESEVAEGQLRTNKIKFDIINKYCNQPGKLFDFGCGNGNFMKYARSIGWDAIGYDVDCAAMQQVEEKLQVPVKCGNFPEIDVDDNSVDLVHAHHVVEHLKNPLRDLKIINRILKKEGLFYVAVPNINAFSARLKFYLEKMGLRTRNIGKYYDSDHHIFYYTPTSMKFLLEQAGFEILVSMNGSKSHMSESPLVQFFTYKLANALYSSSAFLMIARKK